MADLDATWNELQQVEADIHGYMRLEPAGLEELHARRDALEQRMAAVSMGDTLSTRAGLSFVIWQMQRKRALWDDGGALRVALRLLEDVRARSAAAPQPAKVRKARHRASAPPFPRPSGRAPANKTWSEQLGAWVADAAAAAPAAAAGAAAAVAEHS